MNLNNKSIKIAVIGGGNIGTQFACKCASKGYTVNVYTSKPDLFDEELVIVDELGNYITGKINKAVSNLKEAIDDCKIIFVTYPAFMLKKFSDEMLPFIKSDMTICVIPGTGGAEFAFKQCIQAGATLLGLQRTPSVSRLEKYGKRVRCEGLRDELFISSIPNTKAKEFESFFSDLWEIPCSAMPNYLCVTLTPSNPILHTTRLKTLFDDYYNGKVYDSNPLFYGDWSNKSSELLIACDEELQQLCHKLNNLDLKYVRSLKIHYESNTIDGMTKKISSIKSLHNLHSPMKKVENGWIPDFESRYFTADFPYGLSIIESFGHIVDVSMPRIHETMMWYRQISGDKNMFNLSDYGIITINDIYNFYQ